MLRAIVTTRILLAASLFLPSLTAFAASTATTLSLTQGGSPVTSIATGTMITLTASVVAGSTPVTPGLVTFCDAIAPHCSDIHVLGSAQLTAAGTAVLRFTPGVGSHRYKAVFTGTNSEVSSTSSSAALAVSGLDATATVSAYTGSFSNATLSATVGTIDSHGPSGTVSFVDPASTGAPLGSATLGTATAGLGFQPSATFPSIRSLGAAGDFNGDGKLDLVASTVTATGPFLTTLLGNGDGSFTPSSQVLPLDAIAFAIGDFNNDGVPDLATVTYDYAALTLLLGNGDGTFTAAPAVPLAAATAAIVTADFNGDGNADLALVNDLNNTLIILLGDGHGGFTAAASPKAGSYPVSLAAADFDGDGKTDLAVADGASNSVTILHGNGDGTFTLEPTSPATGNFPLQIISADFNSDGKADLAITNQGDGTVTILLGNGNGSFTAAPTLPAVNSYAEDVAVADMNGDGIPDLVVSNDKYYAETILPDPVTVWIGAGNGTFTAGVSPASGREPEALIAADFNGDGRSDLAVLNAFDDQLSILLTANEIATASVTGVPVGSAARLPFVTASYPGDSYHHASSSRGSTQVPSAIFLSPASINFGVGYVDSGAYYWPAMLANGGTQIVDLTRFAFSRPDGSSFGLRNSTCGSSVAPGANCSFSIAFRPTKEGNLTSNFQVYVSDSTSPLQMPLEGFGEGFPVVQLTPSLITFAPTYVGTTAGYQSLTLTNTGTGSLAIYSISIVSEYDPYSWGIRNQTCGNTLAPGASCTLSVAFRPTRAGSIAGAVAVIDNFNSGEQTVSLRGTGK